jgi:hypothetical protein
MIVNKRLNDSYELLSVNNCKLECKMLNTVGALQTPLSHWLHAKWTQKRKYQWKYRHNLVLKSIANTW